MSIFFRRTYAKSRLPPRTLLQRQNKRLGIEDKRASSSQQLIVSSLRDIMSMFQPSAITQDDEEMELLKKRDDIIRRIELGEFDRLMKQKFGAVEQGPIGLHIPSKSIKQAFLSLTDKDKQMVEVALDLIPPKASWDSVSHIHKQLSYYMSFGSYGPRESITFLGKKPEDFTWLKPSGTSCSTPVKKLSHPELTDLLTCTDARRQQLDTGIRTLDTSSRIVLWSAIVVALVASFGDYKRRQDDEPVTVTQSTAQQTDYK